MDADKSVSMISDNNPENEQVGDAAQPSDPPGSDPSVVNELRPSPCADSLAPSSRVKSHLRPSESSADNNLLSFSSSPANRLFNRPLSADNKPRVSLTMIVKNGHDHLPHCLESAAGLFDEIARSLGANVFELPWVDTFFRRPKRVSRTRHLRLRLLARRRRHRRAGRVCSTL
jgi:hypothetical protein